MGRRSQPALSISRGPWLEKEFKEASAREGLRDLQRQLTHEEVLIATGYLKKLIESRPK
jgi:hypothetical protein